ncbi:MAG: hypothetical protein MZV65_53040 [Chromatiales bacterium]|nr:hypothetical protein [Chromatiales bacterium]
MRRALRQVLPCDAAQASLLPSPARRRRCRRAFDVLAVRRLGSTARRRPASRPRRG